MQDAAYGGGPMHAAACSVFALTPCVPQTRTRARNAHCVLTHAHGPMHGRSHTHTHACTHSRTHTHAHTHTHTHTHAHTNTHTYRTPVC